MSSPIYLYSSTTRSEFDKNNGLHRDFLDDVLLSLLVGDSKVGVFEYTPPWALKIAYDVPVVTTVIQGTLWVTSPNRSAQRFDAGDTYIMPHGSVQKPYFVSSSDEVPNNWVTPDELLKSGKLIPSCTSSTGTEPERIQWGGGGEDVVRTLTFTFKWLDRYYDPLIKALPALMRVEASNTGAKLLDLMMTSLFDEASPDLPGFSTLTAQTAQMYLVHCVRTFAINEGDSEIRWLKGLSDPKLAKALSAIHRKPDKKWTVLELGKVAGMSRSSFAKKFSMVMGETPMDYLCSWRMHLARLAIAQGNTNIGSLTQQLGYRSESAFRAAFVKETGEKPMDFAKNLWRK